MLLLLSAQRLHTVGDVVELVGFFNRSLLAWEFQG